MGQGISFKSMFRVLGIYNFVPIVKRTGMPNLPFDDQVAKIGTKENFCNVNDLWPWKQIDSHFLEPNVILVGDWESGQWKKWSLLTGRKECCHFQYVFINNALALCWKNLAWANVLQADCRTFNVSSMVEFRRWCVRNPKFWAKNQRIF